MNYPTSSQPPAPPVKKLGPVADILRKERGGSLPMIDMDAKPAKRAAAQKAQDVVAGVAQEEEGEAGKEADEEYQADEDADMEDAAVLDAKAAEAQESEDDSDVGRARVRGKRSTRGRSESYTSVQGAV